MAERIVLKDVLARLGITRQHLAILVGTDYHPGVPGIGPRTARAKKAELARLEAFIRSASAMLK